MPPRTEDQNRFIRENRHRQLMETALRLFANKGYHNTTIQKISEEAGISKGLLYSYFDGKEDLLMKMIEWGMGGIIRMMTPGMQEKLTRDSLAEVIHALFRMLIEHREFWKLYYSVLLQQDVYEIIRPQFHTLQTGFIEMLTHFYQDAGSENPSARARILHALIEGIYLNYVFSPEGFSLDNLEDIVINRFILEV